MVEAMKPSRDDVIFDPACGSGGFLIMTLRKLRERIKTENPNLSEGEIKAAIKYFADHKTYGVDINDRMVRVAKMNMIMHGDGHSGIFHILRGGGLLTDPNLPSRLNETIHDGSVDVIFSNPPFAGREKDPTILEQFDLGKNKAGKTVSVSKEVLFIEKIIDLLKYGGKAALVLPSGVFNNSSMRRVRTYIKSHAKITALIGLPHLAFQVTGANNEGHLLFMEKTKAIPNDYRIFVDWATDVGIDTMGRKTGRNDLTAILTHFQSPSPEHIIKYSDLKDRIDPWYYHPNHTRLRQQLQQNKHPLVPLKKIFVRSTDRFTREAYRDKVVKYVEKEDVDLEKGAIIGFIEHTVSSLPSWASYILKEGDIIFARAYDSMRGVAVTTKEHERYVATGGLIVVRHNPELILLDYVRHHFTKPEIFVLIKRNCTGEINPKYTWPTFSEVEVPLPSIEKQQKILNVIENIEQRKAELMKEIEKLDHEIDSQVRTAVPKVIENYNDFKIRRAEFAGLMKLQKRQRKHGV
jgi:SAM-dependent methyltransferase